MDNKIINYNDISKLNSEIKAAGKTIILVGGCFDILHPGHITFLKKSKLVAEILIVALENDEKIKLLKGNCRPFNNQKIRVKNLALLDYVNYIIILPTFKSDNDYLSFVKTIKPDIIGITEKDPKMSQKKLQAKTVGAKLKVVTKRLNDYSTSKIINNAC